MPIRVVVFQLMLICGLCGASQGATMHSIVMGDTGDVVIGSGVQGNVDDINRLLNAIDDSTDISMDTHVLSGDHFNCETLISTLDGFDIDKDDIVFIYYSGHGQLSKHNNDFPALSCDEDTTIELQRIYELMEAKQPRLLLVFADTCNSNGSGDSDLNVERWNTAARLRKTALSELFEHATGKVALSSSKANQYSWYTSAHGLFTLQLIGAITKVAARPVKASWDDVSDIALKPIQIPDLEPQQPIGVVDVSYSEDSPEDSN
jgi:hypothetical protein